MIVIINFLESDQKATMCQIFPSAIDDIEQRSDCCFSPQFWLRTRSSDTSSNRRKQQK